MDRLIEETVEGEIGLEIDYLPGKSKAVDVLGGAMSLITAIDALDAALLSSISTELEPVSVLNDIQHSSLRILLARVLRSVPDEQLGSGDWKKWIGHLLVKGKHALLPRLDADAPAIEAEIKKLEGDYKAAPGLVGYDLPKVKDVQTALRGVARARATLGEQRVVVQTELGDIVLGETAVDDDVVSSDVANVLTNRGREYLKVRYPDMLGKAQWTVLRNGRMTRVELLHQGWLAAYHARKFIILPGDSLDCSYEESVGYDSQQNEVERKLSIIEVHAVVSPPAQPPLTVYPGDT